MVKVACTAEGGRLETSPLAPSLQLMAWIEEAGMEAWIDAIGNVHGRINGSDTGAPATVVASHYDTVLDGGK